MAVTYPNTRHPKVKRSLPAGRFALLISIAAVSSTVAWVWNGHSGESHAVISSPPSLEQTTAVPEGDRWVSSTPVLVRQEPNLHSPIRARIPAGEPFIVHREHQGQGCQGPWGETEDRSYACLDAARKTDEMPVRLPRLVRFVHPDPKDWGEYMQTMSYDMSPPDRIDALVPFVYAKRWGKWKGPNYSSLEAFSQGRAPSQQLSRGRKYHFVDAHKTDQGPVLERANGAVVPASDVHIYPLTKFHGWDLSAEPIPRGFLPAWAINYDGTAIHRAPSHNSEVAATLEFHAPILVEDEPIDRAGQWWVMPNGLGPGVPGFVNDKTGIRHWVPTKPPAGIGETELWLDLDLEQQVLGLRRGTELQFATLVSTGAADTPTPRGIYTIFDKSAWTDMASRPDSDDPYYVEKVPWVMHFKKRYALHGTFWHWGFGHTASHGCINLSVRDARWIYDRVSPVAYGGWHYAEASKSDPGTTIRIRRGDGPVRDRRGG